MDATKRAQWLATSVLILTALVLIGLLGRVAWIQKHVDAKERERLAKQHTAIIPLPANRATIFTSGGVPMALSVRMYNLFADPSLILDPDGKLNALKDKDLEKAQKMLYEALAPLCNKPSEEIRFLVESNARFANGSPRRFLWLAREVDEDFYNRFMALKKKMHEDSRDESRAASKNKNEASRIQQAKNAKILFHTLDGVSFVNSVKRVYPLGQLGGHILGFANDYGGVDGMEHQLEDLLKGHPGYMRVIKDASRHTVLIQDQKYVEPDNGRNVWLTVDTVVQSIAEEELAKAVKTYNAEGGTAVVLNPHTGHIVAMANFPSFDPNNYSTADQRNRVNKAVVFPYEPGSIFKPFVMAWAIEKKLVKPTDVFDCHGGRWYDPAGRLVTDTHGYGALSAEDILVKSSNIGMTQIGWRLGIPALHEGITTFGFGARTGVELPGDQKGIVTPLARWNKGTLTSVSFGYEVAATPLQLVRGYATFANDGYLITPHVIQAVTGDDSKPAPWTDFSRAEKPQRIISAATCETMRKMMEGVYIWGTAKSTRSNVYRLFGKTGTAHIAGKARSTEGHGYGDTDYNSSFLAGGPMTHPELVCVVTIHKPDRKLGHFGGTVAAPAATALLERSLLYMQVKPDQVADPGPRKPASGTH